MRKSRLLVTWSILKFLYIFDFEIYISDICLFGWLFDIYNYYWDTAVTTTTNDERWWWTELQIKDDAKRRPGSDYYNDDD